jgi:hypothetical protein
VYSSWCAGIMFGHKQDEVMGWLLVQAA